MRLAVTIAIVLGVINLGLTLSQYSSGEDRTQPVYTQNYSVPSPFRYDSTAGDIRQLQRELATYGNGR